MGILEWAEDNKVAEEAARKELAEFKGNLSGREEAAFMVAFRLGWLRRNQAQEKANVPH